MGRQVEYISTDVSDPNMAKANGVNYVPPLGRGAWRGPQVADRDGSRFFKGEQISVFPQPRCPLAWQCNTNYSPLWRIVMVNWLKADKVRELKSEEEIRCRGEGRTRRQGHQRRGQLPGDWGGGRHAPRRFSAMRSR